ncbi:tetratricopeptide repeat protein [uncultured Microscilla sp.]|uniref:tetratricopeptide repeat protein n=1 Tax=uncultured Microscilla sp. TaxID=432653 RepID=UPI00260CE75F|nr:tetratricopeptide repeat protein [uncultured Microscilla sp.]
MSKTNEENLRAFYEKLLEIKDKEAQKSLSQQELKEIALDLGFSEDEWHLVEQKVEGHLKNGQSFLSFENWNDAIQQFEQALQLSPNNLAAIYGLAIAYRSMYHETSRANYREQAINYARVRLVNEPGHEPSIRIISELQKPSQAKSVTASPHAQMPATNAGSKRASIIVMASVFILFMAGALIFFSVQRASDEDKVYETEKYLPEKTASSSSPQYTVPTNRNRNNVPVKFVKSSWSENFKLARIEKSAVTSSSRQRLSYKLSGALLITGNLPIEELKLKVEFVTPEGKVGLAEYVSVVKKYQPNAIKGDYVPFYLSKYSKNYAANDLSEVRLLVHAVKYGSWKKPTHRPIPTLWAYDRPQGIQIDVLERAQEVRGYAKSTSHKVEVNFINKGKESLQRFKVEAQWLNHNDEIVHSVTRTLVYPHQADWYPNHNRLHRFHAYIKNLTPREIKGYRINIIEASTK